MPEKQSSLGRLPPRRVYAKLCRMRNNVKSILSLIMLCACVGALAETSVTFYGGAGEVGGSCALVESGGYRMLVDCGTVYGVDHVPTNVQMKSGFAFDPSTINCLLLTHAHQDHAGRVPELVHAGFKGEILATEPTRDLLALAWPTQLIYDESERRAWRWSAKSKGGRSRKVHWCADCEWSAKIANYNLRTFTGSRAELDEFMASFAPGASALSACHVCLELEMKAFLARFKCVPYGERSRNGPFTVTFRPVKHIPGSAAIYIAEGTNTLVFSGDLGTPRSHFVREIEPALKADAVFIESTYGDASSGGQAASEAEYARFRKDVGNTVRRGGIAWVPAFALDRSQRVLLEVAQGMAHGEIPAEAPVYMLSSTARNVTRAYIEHPEWFDVDITAVSNLFVRTKSRFSPTKTLKGGGILLTTSGMMDAGSSLSLLPSLAANESVQVCLVGYQAPGTHGYKLRSGAKEITVSGRKVPVRCAVSSYSCFGGHGDATENDAWLANNRNSRIFLIHGDRKALDERRQGLVKRFGATVEIAEPFRRYTFP